MNKIMGSPTCPSLWLQVVEKDGEADEGWLRCEIGRHIRFTTISLESYFFAEWSPVVFDLLLVAAAVEFCDRRLPRPKLGWPRQFKVSIPVHEPDRWSAQNVSALLHKALSLLTGDSWSISFTGREDKYPEVRRQRCLPLPNSAQAVIAFSNGLDSRSVAGLVATKMGKDLVRIRLGPETKDKLVGKKEREAFTSIPYRVGGAGVRLPETSARSRGFKFSVISLAAAYLGQVHRIIVPESGQGALGPVLVPVGHAYADYRNHPQFTNLMEEFGAQLLDRTISYEFPRLWHTKGETLAAYMEIDPQSEVWSGTWSCWQQSRHASVDHKKRQCGICAACMLRRMSVHAAGLAENSSRYVFEHLNARSLEGGSSRPNVGKAMREYALAGTLHLQHLSELTQDGAKKRGLDRMARQVGRLTGLTPDESEAKATRLISQHRKEWVAFVESLGSDSFVANWAKGE